MNRKKSIIDELSDETLERLTSRREVMVKSGKLGLGLALGSLPVMLGMLTTKTYARQKAPQDVIEVLNYALGLEYLERNFYQMGLAAGIVPASDNAIIAKIAQHEAAHVTLLVGAITASGGTPISEPTYNYTRNFPTIFSDYPTFLTVAQSFEDTGVRAYKGRAGELLGTDTLTVALQIHSVEARHAAQIRRMRGLKGWIVSEDAGSNNVPAAAGAVYSGENDMMPLAGGPSVTNSAAYDEPLTAEQVSAIVSLFK